ncbi:MAG: acyl-phosphate glycerol 3-phosphate acyltransferase [Geobacteraceae bacterium GWB2_52_12]|nr:MAG: acyl-phosphate glycerol 3-phosphate acyltransferase [Geobacteraceae bacterium GWB2_52_12]
MANEGAYFFGWLAIAYLIGSVPTGLLLGKLYGIDVRQQGSGNIGATNLYRTLGRNVGVLTLIGDCLKGAIPVLLAQQFGLSGEQVAWVGMAAFCGHVFSVFLKFRGGKGVATALGVFLALSPLAVLIALVLFVLVMLKWRYVSLGSVCAAAVMPLVVAFSQEWILTGVTFLISLVVIVRHRENIRRLLAGTESKFKA